MALAMIQGCSAPALRHIAPVLATLTLCALGCSDAEDSNIEPPVTAPDPVLVEDSAAIQLWYGTEQVVGGPGEPAPQRWVNVLGRITEARASSGSYRINEGPDRVFAFGPTRTRLSGRGDFNLEIERDRLLVFPASNVVEIRVYANDHFIHSRRMRLVVYPAAEVELPRAVDFTALEDITAVHRVAAIVDGRWHLTEDGVRTTEQGYDRLLAFGSQTWSGNQEALAEFIVHSWRAWGSVGIAFGWQGHTGEMQPREEWPLEALGWVRNAMPQPELQIMSFQRGVVARRELELTLGRPYRLRLRTERSGDTAQAFLRVWPRTEKEPTTWQLNASVPTRAGSVLLVTHHADVTWRHLRVDPVP